MQYLILKIKVRTKWNSTSLPENFLPLNFFLTKWRMFKFEKYQCAILGPSSSDSAANIEKKFGKTISWVCMDFKKKPAEKVEFWSKQD